MSYLIMCSISFVVFMFAAGFAANEKSESIFVSCLHELEFAFFVSMLACIIWPISLPALMVIPFYFIGRAAAQKLRKNK